MTDNILIEFAKELSGREIGSEITKQEDLRAKSLGVVIIFGASDDLAEIRGAIYDEASCYDGGLIHFNNGELYKPKCEDESCPHELKIIRRAKTVEAVWGAQDISWTYKTDIPHATFDIMEDGEVYCRGICFRLKDIK